MSKLNISSIDSTGHTDPM